MDPNATLERLRNLAVEILSKRYSVEVNYRLRHFRTLAQAKDFIREIYKVEGNCSMQSIAICRDTYDIVLVGKWDAGDTRKKFRELHFIRPQ